MKLAFVALLFLLPLVCHGYYIILTEGQIRCLSEDLPKDTLLVGKFWVDDLKPSQYPSGVTNLPKNSEKMFGITVRVKDPLDRNVYDKTHDKDSKFALTSQIGGQHTFCIQTNTSSWFNPFSFKLNIEIKTGSGGVDYEKIAKREHLEGLALNVRRLNDRMADVQKEQTYQRTREVEFRDLSEDTNEKVIYWAFFQVAVVVGSAFWQIRHLSNFFRKKKLV